jgi:hemin uptake protein HemP
VNTRPSAAAGSGQTEREPSRGAPQPTTPLRTLSSHALFSGALEIGIEHDGALYRLKITRQGKLILNK